MEGVGWEGDECDSFVAVAEHGVSYSEGENHQSSWKIIKGAIVVVRGKKEDTLYMTVNNHDNIALASANSDADLWHCRLGHMSEKGMKQLCSMGKLPGLKTVALGLCEDCVFGKQKRVSFSKAGRTLKEQKL
ncbi:hypothetical protein CRG98_010298 [Punica granatum]|uniref:GAG-pre-integrase domain-containing protein n=1 Tax=Punica granatum TaxID=22663 RepID=A0A2I0KLA4_PUNGR|nr:hypothetical protein CRG98_010298 [Punica granatum]